MKRIIREKMLVKYEAYLKKGKKWGDGQQILM